MNHPFTRGVLLFVCFASTLLAGPPDDQWEKVDDAMRGRGHYGPRVAVDPGASQQTRLLAFMGRAP